MKRRKLLVQEEEGRGGGVAGEVEEEGQLEGVEERGGCPSHDPSESSSDNNSDTSGSNSGSETSMIREDYQCSICGEEGGNWIGCDLCDKWYHLTCVNVDVTDDIKNKDWYCPDCQT